MNRSRNIKVDHASDTANSGLSEKTSKKLPKAGVWPPELVLPTPTIIQSSNFDEGRTRNEVHQWKLNCTALRQELIRELLNEVDPSARAQLDRQKYGHDDEIAMLEQTINEKFLPGFGVRQLLGPREMLTCPLFRCCSRKLTRMNRVEVDIASSRNGDFIQYRGPELRQSDARVFFALLHMLRDVQVGVKAKFDPGELCRALYDYYDGRSRKALKEHIQRLQGGLICTNSFSVQMCLAFEYPKRGGWTVSLDSRIVKLFSMTPGVWFSMSERLALSDGLVSWLYTYVHAQTSLIPMPVASILKLSGSEAREVAFTNGLRIALRELAEIGTIDLGWSIKKGTIRWRKPVARSVIKKSM